MATTAIQPLPQFFGLDGIPLEGGYIYIGDPNQDPEENPINIYFDEGLTAAAAQPIRTVAGYAKRNGSPSAIYTSATSYSIRVRASDNTIVFYAAEIPAPVVGAGAFGIDLIETDTLLEAQTLLELVPGVDVQVYDADIPTVSATEAQMIAGALTSVRSMSPALVQSTRVRITEDDTTPGFLEDKIDAGQGISLEILNPGANEQLSIRGRPIIKPAAIIAGGETSLVLVEDLVAEMHDGLVDGFDVSFTQLGSMADMATVRIQLGTTSAYETSGYDSGISVFATSLSARVTSTTGVLVGGTDSGFVTGAIDGTIRFRRTNGNTWAIEGLLAAGTRQGIVVSRIALSDALDRVKVISSSAAFSSGAVGIQYWG